MPLHLRLPYRFTAVHSNLRLSHQNGNIVQSNAGNQTWILRSSYDGHGVFIVPKDNQHVCLASNGRENQLTLARVAEQDSCKWQYFEITYHNTLAVCFMINELIDGKIMCADVSGSSMENNARIIMFPVRWMNTQRENQLWIPEIDATA